ncbi:MAG TPA: type II toxin-antitoxin system RelE/ParE family toxin [Micromonosporaceae bacterium]
MSDPPTADLVAAAIDLLMVEGPALGRPLVDRLRGSAFHNMKELRPGSSGPSEVRMLFAFDPRRTAVLLVAGDKARRWQMWYRSAIPLADVRFTEHLAAMKVEQQ